MSKEIREEEIMAILREQKYTTVDQLARMIHISPSSIRRDLTHMEQKGYIRRSHGGASLASEEPGAAPFPFRLQEHKKEKRSIAKAAARLLKKESAIYLDGSTISFQMHPYIYSDMNITVFTNNVYLAQILAQKNVITYCVGGIMSAHSPVITIGGYAMDMLQSVYVEQMFFSASALSAEGLITDISEEETRIRRFMMSHAKEVIYLHQGGRYGSASRFLTACLDEVTYVVTDGDLPGTLKETFSNTEFIVRRQG